MKRRFVFVVAAIALLFLLGLMILQGSFRFSFQPSDAHDTLVLSAVSALIFILAVTLAFMLFRTGVKLYIERQQNREGSRIRSRLLLGALALTLAPTLFSALFNYTVLNRTLDKWFTQPARGIETSLHDLETSFRAEAQKRVEAEANWISLLPETIQAAQTGHIPGAFFENVARQNGIRQLILTPAAGVPMLLYQQFGDSNAPLLEAAAKVSSGSQTLGSVTVRAALASDPAGQEAAVRLLLSEQRHLAGHQKFYQDTYFLLICLLTLFVLFFAAWSAQVLSRQISVPISALLGAAQQVRQGDLSYRIRVRAIDELATLVRAFNAMTSDLEGNAKELEARRRFTEAILESIPTGVISVTPDERIERVNRALRGIFSNDVVRVARKLEDLFAPEELADVRYLLKKARRTGAAACQMDLERPTAVLHLAITVASLEEQRGFVMVLEDTSDLLRAQKAAAWQEVARRIAHEIKNPLTPISLCTDRIARQLNRLHLPSEVRAIFDECTATIRQEVQSVKSLVDEFSQFSRFPAAQPAPADLNEIVESAMAVFAGRLNHIELSLEREPNLPLVLADREQIKRVIVNLIDNAAESMSESALRQLHVSTSAPSPEVVELTVADTGCGVSASDKERLFLPYFSTKDRGTGLGLAIVSHIISEHQGRVRVESNWPCGTRFIVELNSLPPLESPAADLSETHTDALPTATLKR